jgi:hypothetical protein
MFARPDDHVIGTPLFELGEELQPNSFVLLANVQ